LNTRAGPREVGARVPQDACGALVLNPLDNLLQLALGPDGKGMLPFGLLEAMTDGGMARAKGEDVFEQLRVDGSGQKGDNAERGGKRTEWETRPVLVVAAGAVVAGTRAAVPKLSLEELRDAGGRWWVERRVDVVR
jgi:hypothetical protein